MHFENQVVRRSGSFLVFIFGACMAGVGNGLANAQVCEIDQYELVMPPALSSNDLYGSSIEVAGEWLFVGAPGDDQVGPDSGAVYAFQEVDDIWQFRQKMIPAGGSGPGKFGTAIGADGCWLFIGAPLDQDANFSGAVYIFALEGQNWIQQGAKHTSPNEINSGARFGWSIEINGDIAAIGAPRSSLPGQFEAGAVHVFRNTSDEWARQQVLRPNETHAVDWFGESVAIAKGHLFAGAPQNDTLAANAGAAYIFAHDGRMWSQIQQLVRPQGGANDKFGSRMVAKGSLAVITAPWADTNGIDAGAAHLYIHSQNKWSHDQVLVAAEIAAGDLFGYSVAIDGGRILMGAPSHDVQLNGGTPSLFTSAGAAYSFHQSDVEWAPHKRLRLFQPPNVGINNSPYRCWDNGPPPWWWNPTNPSLQGASAGISVAMTSRGFFVGSYAAKPICWGGPQYWENSGALNWFYMEPPDCDGNGIPDKCELGPDCNANDIPDDCDMVSGSTDCNHNVVPDECEESCEYRLNSGFPYSFYTFTTGRDTYILNQHRVQPGGQVITHIGFPRNPYAVDGLPVTFLVYADPTNDGDPIDAVLLAQTEVPVNHFWAPQSIWMKVPMPPTYVGEVGNVFFVGMRVHFLPQSMFAIIPANALPNVPQRCWWGRAAVGQLLDLKNLANNAQLPVYWLFSSAMVLSAHGNDCNGNATPDFCDIEGGTSQDANGDGIPDECEAPPCFWADIYPTGVKGDGVVNVNDLLHVISNWGTCSPCYTFCPGDTNDDCHVNLTDLQAVIDAWGPCP